MSINPSTRFSNDDNQQDCDVVNKVDRNHLIQHPNNNFNSKSKHRINFIKLCYSTHIWSQTLERK